MVSESPMSCPDDVLDLLPWYPDGGLTSEERGRVEAHAATCAECRREIHAWARGSVALPPDAPSPERVLARVFARISEPDAATTPPKAGAPVVPLTGASGAPRQGRGVVPARAAAQPRRHRQPARWRAGWAAAAALALFFGIGGGIAIERLRPDAGPALYQTATAPPEPALAPAGGPALDLVLRDDVTAGRIREVLRAVGAQIVTGPSAVGRYQARLAPGTDAVAVAKMLSDAETGIASFAQPLQ